MTPALILLSNKFVRKGIDSDHVTTAQTLDEIGLRLRNRMLDKRLCNIFDITTPAYRESIPV